MNIDNELRNLRYHNTKPDAELRALRRRAYGEEHSPIWPWVVFGILVGLIIMGIYHA